MALFVLAARRARPARVADRRGDRARRRAHRPRDRRLPERELRQRAGADHRPVRDPDGCRMSSAARSPAASSRTSCSCSASRSSLAARAASTGARSPLQLALVLGAVVLFLVPSVPGWNGNPDRHSLAVADAPGRDRPARCSTSRSRSGSSAAIARLHAAAEHRAEAGGWSLRTALARRSASRPSRPRVVSEILVHSLDAFARRGRALGVLHLGGDRRDRRQRGRARRRDRDRAARQDRPRDRDRDLVERAGRAARPAARHAALVGGRPRRSPLSFRPIELGRDGRRGARRRVRDPRRAVAPLGGRAADRRCYAATAVAFFLAGDR